jgi:threonine/homoserine/homoserine lactone efflux protein
MPDLSTITTFAIASFALLVIPGPAVIYVINRSVADGRTVGLAAMTGLETGNMVHVLAASVGLSAVLAGSALAFNAIKWLGVIYLIGVGINTLRRPAAVVDDAQPSMSPRRAFMQGVVVNTLNVKVALFFLSFLPQFIEPDAGHAGVQSLVLGMVFVAIGVVTDGSYALVASGLRTALVRGRALPFVQRYVAGTVFIALGLLAASTGNNATKTSPFLPTPRPGHL